MTNFDEKIAHLIDVLLEKTVQGKVSWESTANNDTFATALGLYGISISRYVSRPVIYTVEEREIFILTFLDKNGELFDSRVDDSSSFNDYNRLKELFTLARRSANNVDESLDNLLQELQRI